MTTVNADAGNTAWQVGGAVMPAPSAPIVPRDAGAMDAMTASPDAAPPTSDVPVSVTPSVLATPPTISSIAVAAPTASRALHVGRVSISPAWVIAIVAVLLVAVICSAAVLLLSRVGWRRFAKRYPVERPMAGAAFDATLVRFANP